MNGRLVEGDKVRHPKYGEGIVLSPSEGLHPRYTRCQFSRDAPGIVGKGVLRVMTQELEVRDAPQV